MHSLTLSRNEVKRPVIGSYDPDAPDLDFVLEPATAFPDYVIPGSHVRKLARELADRANSGDDIDTDGRTLTLAGAAKVAYAAVQLRGMGATAEWIFHVTYGPAEHRNRQLAAVVELALNMSAQTARRAA